MSMIFGMSEWTKLNDRIRELERLLRLFESGYERTPCFCKRSTGGPCKSDSRCVEVRAVLASSPAQGENRDALFQEWRKSTPLDSGALVSAEPAALAQEEKRYTLAEVEAAWDRAHANRWEPGWDGLMDALKETP